MNGMVIMRNVALALCIGLLGACVGSLDGSSPVDVEDPLEEVVTISSAFIDEIQLTRRAIYLGVDVGEGLLVSSLNGVLLDHTIPVVLDTLDDLEAPAADASCPYIENLSNNATTALSCRYLVERARDVSYVDLPTAVAERPLGDEFLAVGEMAHYELWYSRGALSGTDGAYTRAIGVLRAAGACDQEPGPVESSFLLGVEHGRAVYLNALNARLSTTPPTECDIDGGIITPSRSAAVLAIDTYVSNNPLCPGLAASSIDDQLEFALAEMEYRRGILQGIDEQAVISSQDLLDTWVCEVPPSPSEPPVPTGGFGDPLVLDLAGDGIEIADASAGPVFDLYADGAPSPTAWPVGDDAFLGLDIDGDGRIGDGSEVFGDRMRGPSGVAYRTGFEALGALDEPALGGNDDGVIDSRDAGWSRVLVWNDRNGNGVSESAELRSLPEAGVSSIELDVEPCPDGVKGDRVLVEKVAFGRTDGTRGEAFEVFLGVNRR